MRYGISISTLLVVLTVALWAHQASSQAIFDAPAFNPDSLVDPNTGLPSGVEEQISIEQIPNIPKPGERVSVQIASYTTNLNGARITWTLDGKQMSSQTGATSFQFTAPASGSTSRLVITVAKAEGGTISKTIVISPADVDLTYEADTYAHPFYKGKRLYTNESLVKVIAIPNFVSSNGSRIANENLVYTWKTNGTVQQAASGYGRSTLDLKGSVVERPIQVTVDVAAPNSTLQATQSLVLQSAVPETVLYENNPLLGVVYEKAILGTFLLERPQVDFEGIPYFFSAQYKDDTALDFNWLINGTPVDTKDSNENYMVLRNDKNEEGTALVGVTTTHLQNILQTNETGLKLDFKKVDNNNDGEFVF